MTSTQTSGVRFLSSFWVRLWWNVCVRQPRNGETVWNRENKNRTCAKTCGETIGSRKTVINVQQCKIALDKSQNLSQQQQKEGQEELFVFHDLWALLQVPPPPQKKEIRGRKIPWHVDISLSLPLFPPYLVFLFMHGDLPTQKKLLLFFFSKKMLMCRRGSCPGFV